MSRTEIKKGKCPECNGSQVYTNKSDALRGERSTIAISSFRWFRLESYVCLDCGFFAEFIKDEDLKDMKKIEKVKSNWQKVV
ncbi:MAG: hypothetical protein IAE65_01130 [Ignavibacteria bacterium]|nr:hypothetical protein [Ignavibacteria bacterium]